MPTAWRAPIPNSTTGDCRFIAPGATLELGRIEGQGRITHVWFTIAGQSSDHLRELVLRMYWDGADKPAVECPLGDFFGLGFGRYVEYKSAPIAIGGIKALNCYWPMPFAKGARLTLTNEGSQPVPSCYFNIDYRLDDKPAADVRYFHTQYRQAFPVPKGKDYLILETTGSGHHVGTFLSVMANSDGWWGEGNDKFYVDGAVKPTIEGTGSEDYFCGAWDFQHAFSNPLTECRCTITRRKAGEKRGILNTCYRWHIQDPVPFTKSLRLTIEHGRSGPDDDRKPLRNHYFERGLLLPGSRRGRCPTAAPLQGSRPRSAPATWGGGKQIVVTSPLSRGPAGRFMAGLVLSICAASSSISLASNCVARTC